MATTACGATTTTTFSSAAFLPRLPSKSARFSAPQFPRSFSPSSLKLSESRRFSQLQVRASSEDTSGSFDANELFTDLKEKWDAVENKTTVILYGGGAIVAVWFSSIIVSAINSVPLVGDRLLPKIMELVGLGYTGWFVYRYLLFKSSRKELSTDIEELKKKIAGME
ncbi:Cyanobacterial aminoacyl-tRNA synthetase, CAAD domain [Dillenia turbinata]|uniref:Cyanobacterial aminoacyl-tRNA synthetase, CAAD domain n=1 Tax=Dillenia turbinata TaxID=194707 RepID=A0AAN8Z0J8_9MAGN